MKRLALAVALVAVAVSLMAASVAWGRPDRALQWSARLRRGVVHDASKASCGT